MVWSVQMLIDLPCDLEDPEHVAEGCVPSEAGSDKGVIKNVSQVVHTYDDEWYLTGLNVREDHGVRVSMIYEDPNVDPNLRSDDALWPLAYGLEESFLKAPNRAAIGESDLTVDEIHRRFNHSTNTARGVTEQERWTLPNIMGVTYAEYPHQDKAVAMVTMTRTHDLLRDTFDAKWASAPVTPTLMYAAGSCLPRRWSG